MVVKAPTENGCNKPIEGYNPESPICIDCKRYDVCAA